MVCPSPRLTSATVVARALLGDDPWTSLHNKAPNILVGILLTFALYGLLNWFTRGASMYRKAILAAFLAIGWLASRRDRAGNSPSDPRHRSRASASDDDPAAREHALLPRHDRDSL